MTSSQTDIARATQEFTPTDRRKSPPASSGQFFLVRYRLSGKHACRNEEKITIRAENVVKQTKVRAQNVVKTTKVRAQNVKLLAFTIKNQ